MNKCGDGDIDFVAFTCDREDRGYSRERKKVLLKYPLDCKLTSDRVHRLVVVKAEPSFDYAVDDPDAVGNEHCPADNDQGRYSPKHAPEHTEPEGPDLPPEMAFQERPCHILLLDVVYDDRNDGRYADEIRCCIERVDDRGEGLRRLFSLHVYCVFHGCLLLFRVHRKHAIKTSLSLLADGSCKHDAGFWILAETTQ